MCIRDRDKPITKPDTDNSGTITQEEAQRQATLLDMLSRFIVSLFLSLIHI